MRSKKAFVFVILAVGLTFVLTLAFLSKLKSETKVVVASRAIAAGTRLDESMLKLKSINTSAVLPGALTSIEDVIGQVITAQRMPGDQITRDMIGERAISAIAASLPPDHRAIAIPVDQATGLAGVVRPGDRVTAVALVDPREVQWSQLKGERSHTSVAPPEAMGLISRVAVKGLKVLMVPQTFRYEEVSPEKGLMPIRTSLGAQRQAVVLLDAPLAPQPIIVGTLPELSEKTWSMLQQMLGGVIPALYEMSSPSDVEELMEALPPSSLYSFEELEDGGIAITVEASPVEVLALLAEKAKIHLVLEPPEAEYPTTSGISAAELMGGLWVRSYIAPTTTPTVTVTPTITVPKPTPTPSG